MDQEQAAFLKLIVVVDNIVDIFLPDRRPFTYPKPGPASTLWAEQGLALWLEVQDAGGKITRILYDFGRGGDVLLHNLKVLGLDPLQADYWILSHGHIDHYGGLIPLLSQGGLQGKLVMHSQVFGQRGLQRTDGSLAGPWSLDRAKVERLCGDALILCDGPMRLGPGVFTSGAIPRISELDPKFSAPVRLEGDQVKPDSLEDDMALVINLAGSGLVVITGCCHAGVFNTLAAAQNLFPDQPLHTLFGGLHLNFVDQARLETIITELGKSSISWFAPIHCTGAEASQNMRAALPRRTVFSTTGMMLCLGEK